MIWMLVDLDLILLIGDATLSYKVSRHIVRRWRPNLCNAPKGVKGRRLPNSFCHVIGPIGYG